MNHRHTKQRQAILDTLEHHGGHLTADEIYQLLKKRHPRLSLGTVYRNLHLLARQGILRELDIGLAVTYFETAKEPHFHLICRICGKIEDAILPIERGLAALVRRAAKTDGFLIEEPRLDFIGVCPACRSKRTKATPPERMLNRLSNFKKT
ncbi:MAG: transcriptional repressor [Acidobacteria bacterium]|nr:transcriptional repressor [Acidobacteriota bacterium]